MPLFGRTIRLLEQDIVHGRPLELHSLVYTDDGARKLERILALLMERYSRENLAGCVHSCITELLNNAVRANMKSVFLRDNRVDVGAEGDYTAALHAFKHTRRLAGWRAYFRRRAIAGGLSVRLLIEHSESGIRITVTNNAALLPQDERRIREKFSQAMTGGDIVEFHRRFGDDSEGEGLGFAMNVLYLRAEQLDPSLFRIGVINGETVARLEIPFSGDFVSARRSDRAMASA